MSLLSVKAAPAETRAAFVLLAILTAFRLLYGGTVGLANDETYYWQWSRHLAPSYFDQGPGIAYCIRLGTLFFGDTSLGVRFVPILLATGTGWLTFLTASRWLGARVALWTLSLLAVAPLLAVGGILATYDSPQVFCWAAALYCLTRAVQEEKPAFWYAVGLFVGLGALCKLTMWLFAPCVLLFLLLSPTYRRHLATPHPYLAFLLALTVFSPVVIWSMHHGWTSVLHAAALSSRSRGAPPLRWFGDFLGSQALVVGPLLFLAELYAIGRFGADLRRTVRNTGASANAGRFLFAFTAPILILCLAIALRSKLEANWPAPIQLTGLMAVALLLSTAWERGKTAVRALVTVSVGVSALMTVLILYPALLPQLGFKVNADLAQKANETYGWPELMAQIQTARAALEKEGKPVFVAGINYRVPSLLAFYLPDHPETQELFFDTRRDQYLFWTKPEALIGQNALLCLDADKPESLALARRYFDRVEEQATVTVTRPGFTGNVKEWRLYACRNFHGYDPAAYLDGY
jgi:4-amino-4-deoxy-L-arabinose transferase-like glycosyltransferase